MATTRRELSATNIARLTTNWDDGYQGFRKRDLSACDYVSTGGWTGSTSTSDWKDDRLCTLVMAGVRADGGYRHRWWRSGTGALGFWAAVRDVWPVTAPQRDWCHKLANVLDKRARAKRALHEVMYAAPKTDAETAIGTFVAEFEAEFPKATACLVDQEALPSFFSYPAEHWTHLRTTNLSESPFATVRLRQRVTKGAGSHTKGLPIAFRRLRWCNDAGAG